MYNEEWSIEIFRRAGFRQSTKALCHRFDLV